MHGGGGKVSNIVLVDLDGTLADGEHRLHHIRQIPRDWDGFYAECHLDTPHQEVIDLVNAMSAQYVIIILTARREETREVTEQWLEVHEVTYNAMIMRPEGHHEDDTTWKISIGKLFGLHNIAFVLEDRNRVVEAWRAAGIRCLHVAEGDF